MKHNIFISYAWVDNEVYPSADKGWVSTFVDGLRKHLAHEMGRRDEAERIWLDYEQMRGNDSVTSTIKSQVEASRTLVLVLSNGYLASTWCREELATFVQKFGADSGRIFVVQMSPVEPEPDALRDLAKYSFWYRDQSNQPRTRWFPYSDPTDRDYSTSQQRLACDLAAKLRELARAEAEPGHVSEETEESHRPAVPERTTPAPAPAPAPAPKGNGGSGVQQDAAHRFVLVDGGVEDRELIYNIAERLERHDIGVAIPLAVLPNQSGIKSSTLTRDLRTKLSLCDSVLLVYRRGPVDQVSQHLIECIKAGTRAPQGRVPPSIDLCQTRNEALALGLRPPGMRVHVVGDTCADDCVERFLDGMPQ